MWQTMRAFLRRDFRIALSYRLAFASEIGSMLFSVVTYWLVARLVDPSQVPGGYFSFAAIGLALANLMQVMVLVAGSVRQDQMMGTLEAVVASGTSVRTLAAGMVSYPLASAVVRGAAYGGIAFAMGASTVRANWPLAVTTLVIGSVSFAGLALVSAALVLLFRQAAAATGWLLSILTLAAGVLFPLRLFPSWASGAANLSPFTQTLRLARRALLGGATWSGNWRQLLMLVGMGVACAFLGLGSVAGGLARARRSGTLAHY
jgi:ABC-2 type transport system permease protein